MSPASPLILDLADCRDPALAGGKAVNLGALLRAGFSVPGGFCITTEAYRELRVASCELRVSPSVTIDGQPATSNQNLATPNSQLTEAILAAYRAMGGGPVAVRSSATAEDMADASLAGQYETFLDINSEDDLLSAVERCWSSLDSPRTRTYLAEHDIAVSSVAMAVVVQRLVLADVSGVLFCANPQTGSRRELLVEASWGLGEAIVSGLVQPDILRIERETGRVLGATIAEKLVQIRPGDHEPASVPEDRRKIACLKAADVEKLWRLALQAERHFGWPQDIEWAISDGQLYLLQSRPITTLQDAETYEQLLQSTRQELRAILEHGGPLVLHNLAETLKHPTPLTWSIIRRFMSGDGGFGRMYRFAGFEPSGRVCSDGFLHRIAGRIYMDLAVAPEIFFDRFPFRYDLALIHSNPDSAQAPPTIPTGMLADRFRADRRISAIRARIRTLSQSFDRELADQHIPEFVEYCRQEKSRDLSALDSEQFIACFKSRQQRVLDDFGPQSLLPSLIAAMGLADLRAFLEEHFWDDDPDALAGLLSSVYPPDKTMQASAQLYDVASGRMTQEQWLGEHGHRAPDEFDLATPRWRQQQSALGEMARQLQGGVDPRQLRAAREEAVAQRLNELRAQLAPAEFKQLEAHIAMLRRYLPYREDGKFYLMLGFDLLRDAALEAGRRIEIDSDVFYLTEEELIDAVRVGFAPTQLIAQRKRQYAAEKKLSLPRVIDESGVDSLGQPAQLSAADSHRGFAVSTGTASGAARIVRSAQHAGDLGRGYVLICPSTDPNWTPLFVNASALILECGGTLSHGAVVAREMNIPAVVLPGATSLFQDGQLLRVDGRNGIISLAHDAGAADGNGKPPAGESPDAEDVRIPRSAWPPPPGQVEGITARLRNYALVFWGAFLLLAFVLPERMLYQPAMRLIDGCLWPLVHEMGKPGAVAVIAALSAGVMLLLQKFLTDNERLNEAKRRAVLLRREAAGLPEDSPRRQALLRLAAPVQMRLVAAALVPLALLLGPMIMVFLWFPARVDPASWSAAPDKPFSIVAHIDSDLRKSVTLDSPGLLADSTTPAQQSLEPLRETLERYARRLAQSADLSEYPPDLQWVARWGREQRLRSLQQFLDRGIEPQPITWTLRPQTPQPRRYYLTLRISGERPISFPVVLGDRYPPAPMMVGGNGASIRSIQVVQPRNENTTFIKKFTFGRYSWEPGWLTVYLLVYIPVMFAFKWIWRVA